MKRELQKANCGLCERVAELQESHIIPKFAIRWLKETGTGYFRRIESPNVRLQDGIKQRLLCVECEQRFGSRESYFASQLFKPILEGATQVVYDERFSYFLVSLLWRALRRHLDEARSTGYRFINQIQQAEEEWRRFLLGQGQITKFNHLHIFIADIAVENPPGVPKFNLYCARACDTSFFDAEGRCYVIVKFATFFCTALLTPYVEAAWKGTRVSSGAAHSVSHRRSMIPLLVDGLWSVQGLPLKNSIQRSAAIKSERLKITFANGCQICVVRIFTVPQRRTSKTTNAFCQDRMALDAMINVPVAADSSSKNVMVVRFSDEFADHKRI